MQVPKHESNLNEMLSPTSSPSRPSALPNLTAPLQYPHHTFTSTTATPYFTMAEEPQPSNIQEGVDAPESLPANAEDRKAAKAMSSLESNKIEDDAAGPKKEVDMKALNDAITKLGGIEEPKKPEKAKKEEGPPKPVVKVDQADVTLLVRTCDRRDVYVC